MLSDKTILITGGAGSFGSAFCKHIKDKAKKVIVLSRGEHRQKELRTHLGDPENFRWFIGDVRDKDRLSRAFEKVDFVIHAAAQKDIESCEYNPSECMKTNVQGTQNVVDICIDKEIEKAILISTDKAVEPINVYGKSKALAEGLFIDGNNYSAGRTKFSVCRYGNVVGSAGSVVPVWRQLVDDGAKTLPVTDEKMTRFWFEMKEAIKFVLDSLGKMQGGEIFVPQIPSIKIVDLAKAMDMPYRIIGVRKNEKIHEKLSLDYDSGSNPYFLTIEEIKESLKNV